LAPAVVAKSKRLPDRIRQLTEERDAGHSRFARDNVLLGRAAGRRNS
jgi:hypothetical protein